MVSQRHVNIYDNFYDDEYTEGKPSDVKQAHELRQITK